MQRIPPPPCARELGTVALFMDVDGTLLDITDHPQQVRADAALLRLLRRLQNAQSGAIALVSGRDMRDIDAIFSPLHLPCAGGHGLEMRDARGRYQWPLGSPSRTFRAACESLHAELSQCASLVIELKSESIAVHFRAAPELERAVAERLERVRASLGENYEILRGKMVMELRPAAATKATALSAFMQAPWFDGRLPVYVGDDVTDECAFEWVNDRGGISVIVAPERHTAARFALANVPAARAWLAGFGAT